MSPNFYSNYGGAATAVVKAAPGVVYSITCHNENAADRWFQLFDKATAVQASDVPKVQFLVPASSQIGRGDDHFTKHGVAFTSGIAFGFSTTKDLYTGGTASEQSTEILYA